MKLVLIFGGFIELLLRIFILLVFTMAIFPLLIILLSDRLEDVLEVQLWRKR